MATAKALELEPIRRELESPRAELQNPFVLLSKISSAASKYNDDRDVQDIILRALDIRHQFGQYAPILDALVRKFGLFPYLEPTTLGVSDLLAYEFHRPINLPDVVFHEAQGRVYRELIEGRSVVLSAPTSFGKSLIIDAIIALRKFDNIVIIVPTIALIDETRRRLSRFSEIYKIITHPSQEREQRNVFVFTQERLIEFPEKQPVDFFVIDEFYKLHMDMDPDRSLLLNQAFYRLYKRASQFYMLGPNVNNISEGFPQRFQCTFIKTDYQTVVSEVHRIRTSTDERVQLKQLTDLCRGIDGPTLIYCQSPVRARTIAKAFMQAQIGNRTPSLQTAAQWISENYHPDWLFVKALNSGIGIHHGRIPRALAQFVVRAFDNGDLQYLICTSTLIEGVNTKAKNVIIFDNRVAVRNLDYFTFNNIKGRSGRMFEHYIGHVYLFHDPPEEKLPTVEIPILTQDGETPESLLVQLDYEDLNSSSKARLGNIWNQNLLSVDTIKLNAGVDPDAQIRLAQHIEENLRQFHHQLSWRRMPQYEQLTFACSLIWNYLLSSRIRQNRSRTVSSSKQLAFMLERVRTQFPNANIAGFIKDRLADRIRQEGNDIDKQAVIDDALDFIRQWMGYHVPRAFMVLYRIQQDVLMRNRLPAGDYRHYAAQVENFFVDSSLVALDEYGIPLPLAVKLARLLSGNGSIDTALANLRRLSDVTIGRLSAFEMLLVENARSFL